LQQVTPPEQHNGSTHCPLDLSQICPAGQPWGQQTSPQSTKPLQPFEKTPHSWGSHDVFVGKQLC
jgi:hypothetical protein